MGTYGYRREKGSIGLPSWLELEAKGQFIFFLKHFQFPNSWKKYDYENFGRDVMCYNVSWFILNNGG